MKARYDEKTQKFHLVYKDAVKEFKGAKYIHTTKQESWKGDKKPTAKEIKIKIAELMAKGAVLENEKRIEAEKLRTEFSVAIVANNPNKEINAVHYFSTLTPEQVTKRAQSSVAIKRIERHIKRFKEFLLNKYPLITLDNIKRNHIFEYFTTLTNFCEAEQKAHYTYLNKIFEKIVLDNEESSIKYVNPLKKIDWTDLITPKEKNKKIGFTPEQVRDFFAHLIQGEKSPLSEQEFAMFYFLMVTGWRISDVNALKWEQVDMNKRIISLIHKKTKKSTGHETRIYITPLMMNILERMKENQKKFPFNLQFVFNQRRYAKNTSVTHKLGQSMQEKLATITKKMGILKTSTNEFDKKFKNYTLHCFRKSLITELTLADFKEVRIDYLVGHSNNSINGQHYLDMLTYPERTTRRMIEHIEQSMKLGYFWRCMIAGTFDANKEFHNLNKWLNASIIETMKINFWNEKALNKLEELHSNGVNIILIETIIQLCNKWRTETAEAEVTKDKVEDFYQMAQWAGLNEKLKETFK